MNAPVFEAAEVALEGADEETWLDARDYGGSTIGTLLGLNKYATPISEFLYRTGQVERPEVVGSPATWGKRLETVVREGYSEDFDTPTFAPPPITMYRSRELAIATYTPDGFIGAPDSVDGLYEGKVTRLVNEWDEETKRAPLSYEAQVVWGLGILGLPFGDLVALIENNLVRIRIEAEPLVFADMLAAVETFEDMVQRGIMPDPDASEVTRKALGHRTGELIESITLPDSYLEDRRAYAEMKAAKAGIEVQMTEIENRFLAAMGDHKEALVGDVKVASISSIKGGHREFDVKPFRRLNVSPIKEKKN